MPVDLSGMARLIAEGLKEREPHRSVTFVIQDGLIVKADPALLQAALQNLLNNAWKFSSRTNNPRIEVGRLSAEEIGKIYAEMVLSGIEPPY